MKLGVDTYTTHSQGWDIFQTLDYLKKIQVDVAHLAGPSLSQCQDEDFLRSVKQHANGLGLEIETGMGSIWEADVDGLLKEQTTTQGDQ